MGEIYLLGQDNAIIGIGFAQFVLEGHIDSYKKHNNYCNSKTITSFVYQSLCRKLH
jgi:hypothetical protein